MAKILPFKAIRPASELASQIAALPYDVYSSAEAREYVKDHPKTFLGIDRAETLLEEGTSPYEDRVYQKAREVLWDMVDKGEFIRDDRECYYAYELTMDGRSQTGIVAVASVDDYDNNVIKKHENTRADKEADRIRHVDVCGAQTGPIFLAFRHNKAIRDVIETRLDKDPVYDFTSEDGIRHRVWTIDRPRNIQVIKEAFGSMEEIYIADGHHRCASAVRVSKMRREANPGFTGDEDFNYFLCVAFPDDELKILDYNRVVKDLAGMDEKEFMDRVSDKFYIEKSHKPVRPSKKGEFGMYLKKGGWYTLTAHDDIKSSDPVKGLDVSILQDNLLGPILNIQDPKTDSRIDFVGGIRGLSELERRVKLDCVVAFSMYPTDIRELFSVADAGLLMPPKSTWFEPKLRSGLFIHQI
ncbi:MAG: DUF1015 domain-containing protein [Lachnospiraceae bacterium]|nr:DUF1015 domain-containing protein [Lachnospiraceae bacterium]